MARHTGAVSPLDYLLEVVRDESAELAKRLDAAKAAAPYLHERGRASAADKKLVEAVLKWARTEAEALADPSKRS